MAGLLLGLTELCKTPSYLHGEVRRGGWWYYYLCALAVKVPLGTWILLGLSLVLGLSRAGYRSRWRDEIVLLLPLLLILTFVSAQTGINKHLRYLLPIFPLAFVWASRVACCVERKQWKIAAVAAGALLWSVASSLWVYPHSLSYFSELAGGPQYGHEHLLSSNISWGQDLLYLKRWLDQHPEARPLHMAVHAAFDPRDAGIEFTLPPPGPASRDELDGNTPASFDIKPGWYAIDVNLLQGFPYAIPDGTGNTFSAHQQQFTYFKRFKPVAMAGYSIYIYHVTAEDVR